MRRLRVDRIAFPQDSDHVTLGTGTDAVSDETVRFVIPPNLAFRVLTELHAGRHPQQTPFLGLHRSCRN